MALFTLIPAFDTEEPRTRFAGLLPLVGGDNADMPAGVIGLIPVQVEPLSLNGRTAWSRFFTALFGGVGDQWWEPKQLGSRNNEAFELYRFWIQEVSMASVVPGDWLHCESIGNYRPMRVVDTWCPGCVRKGGVAITLMGALFSDTPGHKPYWAPLELGSDDIDTVRRSHLADWSSVHQRCLEIHMDNQAADDPSGINELSDLAWDDLSEAGYDDYVNEIENEVSEELFEETKRVHAEAWYAPDSVRDTFHQALTKSTDRMRPLTMSHRTINDTYIDAFRASFPRR